MPARYFLLWLWPKVIASRIGSGQEDGLSQNPHKRSDFSPTKKQEWGFEYKPLAEDFAATNFEGEDASLTSGPRREHERSNLHCGALLL